jgi:transglutaminase-like putative cysteine protease
VCCGGLPHLFTVVPWVPLVVLGMAWWRIAAAMRDWKLPSLWVRVPVTVLGFLGVAGSYRSVSGVEAGSALLLVMAGLKLLETRDERDRILVVLIAYFLLFTVFLREQAIWSVAWLVAGLLGVTMALTQTVRRERLLSLGEAARLSGRLLLQGLPVAAVLFLLFPRIPGPFWSLPNARLSGVSGLSDEIRPGDIAELGLSDAVAFRVRFEQRVPRPEDLYWRGPVLERFDGRGWTLSPGERRAPGSSEPVAGGGAIGYQIVLEPHGQRWLLALDSPVSWSAPRARLSAGGHLLAAEPVYERLSYQARSVPTPRRAAAADPDRLRDNLRLPADRNPQALALAEILRREARSDRDFLRLALDLFARQSFSYTLSPPPLGEQPVDEFLFSTRAGFCEHYASALAVLARAAGIPARVVVGYQGSEPNPFSDYWIVRQANAHAWTEVWLDDGWERIDPTSVVAPARLERGFEELAAGSSQVGSRLWRSNAWVNRLVLSWDAVNAAWDRWVLAYGPDAQDDLQLVLGFDVPRPAQLALLAGGGTVVCLLVLALWLRRGDRPRPDPLAQLYAEFCRHMAGAWRARAPAESPLRYAESVAAARPDLAGEVRRITELYLRLRYGAPAPSSAPAAELARRVRGFRPVARAPA